jgi:VIT1/CCC1 family predicted Fe2+/Mn2+ transporter
MKNQKEVNMNKSLFYTGISFFALEGIGALVWALSKVNTDTLLTTIVISAVVLANLLFFIMMIMGIISKE